jgi:hypothetical protein
VQGGHGYSIIRGVAEISGVRARLARVALHDFCIWLNSQLGVPGWLSPRCLDGDLKTHTKRLSHDHDPVDRSATATTVARAKR